MKSGVEYLYSKFDLQHSIFWIDVSPENLMQPVNLKHGG